MSQPIQRFLHSASCSNLTGVSHVHVKSIKIFIEKSWNIENLKSWKVGPAGWGGATNRAAAHIWGWPQGAGQRRRSKETPVEATSLMSLACYSHH